MKPQISYQCTTHKTAWNFLRALEKIGVTAGFPSLKPVGGYYTVAVLSSDVDAADEVYATIKPGAGDWACPDCGSDCAGECRSTNWDKANY